jgi:hypothetical protein
MKVIIALALVAVLAALGTRWARDQGESLLHRAVDTTLPAVVAHRWTPLRHGKPVRAERVSFGHGLVTTARCHATLGSYSVRIDHGFSFQKANVPLESGCPGRALQKELAKATRVDVASDGSIVRLVLTDDRDHTVAELQGRGD